MFKSTGARKATVAADFSQLLRDRSAFAFGHLADLGLGADLTAHAYDPVQSLLAVGTGAGGLFVFGRPGVQLKWDIGRSLKIKHLAFKAGSGLLAAVDSKDTLSVYDLSRLDAKGKPVRDSSLSMRASITCLEASATIGFLFCGGKDGTVDVFDIDRGVLAPHARIPNLWLAQEEILRRSGVADAPSRRHIPVCTDIKAHPVDLNLLLIAYEGGVSLWNIALRRADRNWEFVVPPGAPGGGNDSDDLLFSERRPEVTCLAWRPDGLMFVAGHADGCLSFVCVSDENLISMRTIERADVNKATEEDMFGWSAQGEVGHRKPADREPIFRLAWSGFPEETYYEKAVAGWGAGSATPPLSPIPTSGTSSPVPSSSSLPPHTVREERTNLHGGTILTVLGGLLPKDPTGIHLLELPAYVAPSSTATTTTGNIPAPLRQALRDSVLPLQHNFYPTPSPPEDFLLLPRQSPHFGNSFDPTSILITSGIDASLPVLPAPHSPRGLEAWTFPPSSHRPARRLRLPPALAWSGSGSCSSARVFNLSTLSYQRLLHQLASPATLATHLPLRGGKATALPRPTPPDANSIPDITGQQPRILVSLHVDLSIRFWDISDALLRGNADSGILSENFPRELEHLEVKVRDLLSDPLARDLEASRILRERPWELELDKADLATDTLELAITLSTGEAIVFRLVYGQKEPSAYRAALELEQADIDAHDAVGDALADLSLIPEPESDFPASPSLPPHSVSHRRLSLSRPRLRSVSIKSMATQEPSPDLQDHYVDLSLVLDPTPGVDGFRPCAAFRVASSRQTCLAMSDVGFLATSANATLLIVDMRGPEVLLYDSPSSADASKAKAKQRGDPSAITNLTWTISSLGEDHDRSPRLIVVQESGYTRIFELSQVAGSWLLAANVVSFQHDTVARAFSSFVLDKAGVAAFATPARLQQALVRQANVEHIELEAYFNIDGPRTAYYEGEGFVQASLAVRFGCPVVVVASRSQTLTVLSLPDLTHITRMTFGATLHAQVGEISFSRDGDLVQVVDPLTIRLHTMFDFGRASVSPIVVLHRPEIWVPAQLTTLTSIKSSFYTLLGGPRVYGSAEIETILGGPERPPPKQRGAPPPVTRPSRTTRPRTQQVQSEVDTTSGIIARTTEALQERGESLGYLQARLGTMANDAAKFAHDAAKQAKQEAAKATLKNSVSGYMSKLF